MEIEPQSSSSSHAGSKKRKEPEKNENPHEGKQAALVLEDVLNVMTCHEIATLLKKKVVDCKENKVKRKELVHGKHPRLTFTLAKTVEHLSLVTDFFPGFFPHWISLFLSLSLLIGSYVAAGWRNGSPSRQRQGHQRHGRRKCVRGCATLAEYQAAGWRASLPSQD